MKKKTLRTQLSLIIALLVFISISLISIVSTELINQQFENYLTQVQIEKSETIKNSILQQYDEENNTWQLPAIHAIGMYALNEGYIISLNDGTNTLWDATNHDMEKCEQVMKDIAKRMNESHGLEMSERTTKNIPLQVNDRHVATLTIEYYGPFFLSENDAIFISTLHIVVFAIGSIAMVCAMIIGSILAKRISKPIKESVAIANTIAHGNYSVRFSQKPTTKEVEELMQAIQELVTALDEQERLRKQLTQDVAHELRTPLTTITTHLDAIIDGIWLPSNERLVSLQEEIKRITSIVSDLESLAHYESETLRLHKQKIDVFALTQKLCKQHEIAFFKKQITLQLKGEPCFVEVDEKRISQAILNILTNAIKYTPNKGIINVSCTHDNHFVYLSIRDNGIGIEEKELPFIFDRFYRADKSRNRENGGAGIGLTITKQIVALHDGKINVVSSVDKGTTFTIQLQLT